MKFCQELGVLFFDSQCRKYNNLLQLHRVENVITYSWQLSYLQHTYETVYC